MWFDDLDWLGSRERFGDGGLPDLRHSGTPLLLVALIPLEIQQATHHPDKTEQTEDRDDDKFMIHSPNLRLPVTMSSRGRN